ncbi:DNA polymerase ligase N-terminal domain-containing protein [Streptomyces melanosporofaciens]|uniref:DNA ligase D, 3'-phosphoesterase domain-containing protein n=1 Tax=Streptomyces melanosporofaciens TaxID=67327 RepID=A0A1H5ATE6_STRMJ|nr:DNA polymerase ligase N-terminal domain-containing protein [Streptomyces melanosporofaciens]SED45643.1 DNA ligase D, 3'-phosphoesterase domain-containing protein [Streptomyces melanosporofaciens]
MPTTDDLEEYRRKRDFAKSAEPKGGVSGGEHRGAQLSFVVQIHDATTTHFDFRLEVDGVLKSWAVPKGPSGDPHDKRLAMPTEDHPLEYADFEGTIAEGEYGAGTVILWDEGTYRSTSADREGKEIPFAEALERGHASFQLRGHKLHGGYALTRIRQGTEREAWLLVKKDDTRGSRHRTPDPARARSVRTRRTLRQVAAEADADADSRQ